MTYTASATDLTKPQLGDAVGVAADEIRLLKEYVAVLAASILPGLPQNLQNVNYTLVLADKDKHLYHTSATPHTFTLPSNAAVAYDIGTCVTFINGNGAGALTIGINVDTLRFVGTSSTGPRTLAANGMATAIKVTSTLWYINGTGLT